MKLIEVAPSEKCFVIILSVENTSQRSWTDFIKVVYGVDLQDRRLRDLSVGQVHAQALEISKLVKIRGRDGSTVFRRGGRNLCEGYSGINIPLRHPLINLHVVCCNRMSSLSTYSTFVSWHEPDKFRIVLVAEASVLCWVYGFFTGICILTSGCTFKSCLLTQECRLGTL